MGTPNKTFFCAARRGPTVWIVRAEQGHDRLRRQQLREHGRGAQEYCIRISQITDGTASTLLVADKSLKPDGLTGSQADDTSGYYAGRTSA